MLEEQQDIHEYDEVTTEPENSEDEDEEMEKSDGRQEIEDRDERETNEEYSIEDEEGSIGNEEADEIQAQPIRMKARGRPKGTMKNMMEVKKHLRREEEERKREQGNARRSERIKNQQYARITMDKDIPKNINEAKNSSDWTHWRQAINEELISMKKHEVWDTVSRPKDKRVIKCKWIFDIKEDPNTGQQRYKARLVALGCGQRPGVDYGETFAPVVRTETVRLLFNISAQENRMIKIYDIKTAFLHGNIREEIFMELPDGLRDNKGQVCKLKKSIYGLKQAGKCWNEFLTDVLIRCGLRQSKEDSCLFYVKEKNRFLYCGIHVDDMPIVSSDDKFEKNYIDKIREYIDIKDLGEAKVVLGMQVEQKVGKLYVHQKMYIEKLLELYGMKECNAVKTPMDIHTKFENCEESKKADVLVYQELLGRLMYLSVHTRPDLSFALSCLSQFNNDPKEMHMNALKRILRYLKGTVDNRLEYKRRNPGVRVKCESDASWDRTQDAKSFTGLLLYVNGNLIHWRSRKQSIVALSSTESELEAMLEGLKEIVWSCKLI